MNNTYALLLSPTSRRSGPSEDHESYLRQCYRQTIWELSASREAWETAFQKSYPCPSYFIVQQIQLKRVCADYRRLQHVKFKPVYRTEDFTRPELQYDTGEHAWVLRREDGRLTLRRSGTNVPIYLPETVTDAEIEHYAETIR
ncbi:hypothetical protein EBT31_03940 [bacterium]|nr:hypothetical protein [bacterium]